MTELRFLRIGFNSSIGNDEAEQFSGGYSEDTLLWVELDVVCSEIVERKPQVIY